MFFAKDFFKKNKGQNGIITALTLILAFIINCFIFQLNFVLSSIYDIIIMIILNIYFSDREQFGNIYDVISIVLMAESVIISFNTFKYNITRFFFWTYTEEITIAPNMTTILISFGFLASFWIRNGLGLNRNKPIYLVMHILIILFFASLISVLVSNKYITIPIIGETNYTPQSLYIILMVLSWVGIKSVSMITIPVMAILSTGRIGEVNKAMGSVGVFYLLFAYIAIILQAFYNEKISTKYKKVFGGLKKDFFY